MTWKRVKIASVVLPISRWNPARAAPEEELEYIDLSSVDKDSKSITGTTIYVGAEAPSRAQQLVQTDDVLVSTVRPNLNGVAYVFEQFDGATASTGYCVLRPNKALIDPRYLFHWAKTKGFVDDMVKKATGANYPAVSEAIVKGSEIPLPPLPVQQRIAAVLDEVDALRQKRERSIEFAGTVSTGIFQQMFGNVVKNSKDFEVRRFGEVATSRLGKMLDKKLQSNETPKLYLRNTNVQWDHLELSDLNEMTFTKDECKKFSLRYGDLLVCEGGEVGRAAIWRDELTDCYFQKALHRVRADASQVKPEYLLHYLWQMASREGFKDFVTVATIAHLTGEKLALLPVPIPAIEEQEEFTNLYNAVRFQRDTLLKALKDVEILSQTLQSRAFSGGLDLRELSLS